jgi:hypothetical protein
MMFWLASFVRLIVIRVRTVRRYLVMVLLISLIRLLRHLLMLDVARLNQESTPNGPI